MVVLLRRQQQLDKDMSSREQNWREYVRTREAYLMAKAREDGDSYTPIEATVSAVELCKSERQRSRLN